MYKTHPHRSTHSSIATESAVISACIHIHPHTSLPIPSHTSPSPHTPKASFTTTLTHLFWRSPTRAADKSRSTWVWCTWTSQTGGAERTFWPCPRASCPEPGSPTLTVCGWSDHASAPAACWRKPADVRPLCLVGTPACPTGPSTSGAGVPAPTPGTGSPAYRQLSITSGPTISRAGTQALTQGSQCSITSGPVSRQMKVNYFRTFHFWGRYLWLKADKGQLHLTKNRNEKTTTPKLTSSVTSQSKLGKQFFCPFFQALHFHPWSSTGLEKWETWQQTPLHKPTGNVVIPACLKQSLDAQTHRNRHSSSSIPPLTLSSLKTATAVERIFPFIPENC